MLESICNSAGGYFHSSKQVFAPFLELSILCLQTACIDYILVISCFSSLFFLTCYSLVLIAFRFWQKLFSFSTGFLVTVPDPVSCLVRFDVLADTPQGPPAAPRVGAEACSFYPT